MKDQGGTKIKNKKRAEQMKTNSTGRKRERDRLKEGT